MTDHLERFTMPHAVAITAPADGPPDVWAAAVGGEECDRCHWSSWEGRMFALTCERCGEPEGAWTFCGSCARREIADHLERHADGRIRP